MRRRFTYANVAATLALVFSMTGGALAANHYLISSTAQIKPSVLEKLHGRTGKTGRTGATGAAGREGAAGKEGATGKEGPRGPGIVAAYNSEGKESCTLGSSGGTVCYPATSDAFTPAVDAKCSVDTSAQIETGTPGKPTTDGPYFRTEIKEDSTQEDDGSYGHYLEGTEGDESTSVSRNRIIEVKAGHAYAFGVFFSSAGGEWPGKTANFTVDYTCFG